jgi:uncharacterized membrane protein
MEETIKILIYIHAFFGGIGLITGIGSIVAIKGSVLHKKMGKIFSIGMMSSSLLSIPISWMPNHKNLFLFLIGLFTIYLVLAGNRALKYKRKTKPELIDKIISGSMFIFSSIMVGLGAYNLLIDWSTAMLYLFFGGFGLFFTIVDFRFYRNPGKKQKCLFSFSYSQNEWSIYRFSYCIFCGWVRFYEFNILDTTICHRNHLYNILEKESTG